MLLVVVPGAFLFLSWAKFSGHYSSKARDQGSLSLWFIDLNVSSGPRQPRLTNLKVDRINAKEPFDNGRCQTLLSFDPKTC